MSSAESWRLGERNRGENSGVCQSRPLMQRRVKVIILRVLTLTQNSNPEI